MKLHTRQFAAALSAVLSIAMTLPAAAQDQYRFTSFGEVFADLDTPLPPGTLSPACLSDNGVIGFINDAEFTFFPASYLIEGDEWEKFLPFGITGINASGTTVGSGSLSPFLPPQGWMRTADGTVTPVIVPSAASTTPRSISANGVIGGTFRVAGGLSQGFLWDDKGLTVVNYPGAVATQIRGVNASGTSVGIAGFPIPNLPSFFTVSRAFIRGRSGEASLLDIPDQVFSTALGINNRGDVVGSYRAAANPFTTLGFVANGDSFTTIDTAPLLPLTITFNFAGVLRTFNLRPTSVSTSVVAVNTRGDILTDTRATYTAEVRPGQFIGLQSLGGFVGERINDNK